MAGTEPRLTDASAREQALEQALRRKQPPYVANGNSYNSVNDLIHAHEWDDDQSDLEAADAPRLAIATVCGGSQARICRVTGRPHDMSAFVAEANGGSVACKDCGVTAMSLDLLELP